MAGVHSRVFLSFDNGLSYVCHFGCEEEFDTCEQIAKHYLEWHEEDQLARWNLDMSIVERFIAPAPLDITQN